MSWDFETDREYQVELDWADAFVREHVEPLDFVLGATADRSDQQTAAIVESLQQQVKDRGLWACHLSPALGGMVYGQVKLALLNECLGRSRWAPTIFGCQAPDAGNAEILARFGTEEQKARYLEPLLEGRISSCYSMTELHAGADPTLFTTTASRDGDEWVIDGEKWFSTNARHAAFFIVMAVTNADVPAHKGMSLFVVPAGTPGLETIRNVGIGTEHEEEGQHSYLRYRNVRVTAKDLLGEEGEAFSIAQTRLGGGRIHHAMRTIGQVRMAFDMMCERVVSRQIRGGSLATLQMTQEKIADSWLDIEQFRLLVLRTAWLIDKYEDYGRVRGDISGVKAAMPRVFHDVVLRAMQLHGALGVSNEMPFSEMMTNAQAMAIADGPTEVHKLSLARQILKAYAPIEGPFPTAHLPSRRRVAERYLADWVERTVANF
jgi:acyl-CoA dehydrogenase